MECWCKPCIEFQLLYPKKGAKIKQNIVFRFHFPTGSDLFRFLHDHVKRNEINFAFVYMKKVFI
jgi:hypothetical protein